MRQHGYELRRPAAQRSLGGFEQQVGLVCLDFKYIVCCGKPALQSPRRCAWCDIPAEVQLSYATPPRFAIPVEATLAFSSEEAIATPEVGRHISLRKSRRGLSPPKIGVLYPLA